MLFRVATLLGIFTVIMLGDCGTLTKPNDSFNWDNTKYVVAFGDSYTFVQGTEGLANYSFIGDFLPGDLSFTPHELFTDKIVQNFTGTAEGGTNWIEYLTGCAVEDGEYYPSDCDIQLWDFAFAGSDVSEAFLPLHHNYTVPLVNQTRQYLTYAEPVLSKTIDKKRTLVAIWIGINDISDSMSLTNVSYPDFWKDIIDVMFSESVKSIYAAGYHNFLFMNLPPLDRTLSNQGKEDPSPNATEIGWWNSILLNHTESFKSEHPDVTTLYYDANTFLNGVMDDPEPYGITNLTYCVAGYNQLDVLTNPGKYGCQPIDTYFWYNSGHMSSQTHKVLAEDVAKFLKSKSVV
ncbi:lysophospholipase A [Xylariales sp. PMI_506]|nr:lysophospholipase A [Xylariales sp. PMI_506]